MESANKPRGEHHSALDPSNHVLKETLLHVITARERENRTEQNIEREKVGFISFQQRFSFII